MEKINYGNWLPELKSMTLFQDIEGNNERALLEEVDPMVVHRKAEDKPIYFIPEHAATAKIPEPIVGIVVENPKWLQ